MQASAPAPTTAGPDIGLLPIEYRDGDVRLRGELALPAGDGPHPGILVLHSGLGMTDVLRAQTRRLAHRGYAAFAADLYASLGDALDPAIAGERMMALQAAPDRLRSRVDAGLSALRDQSGVDATRLGSIGFCFGGQCALELARSGADVRVTVSFHGVLKTARPAAPGSIRGQVAVHTGARDPLAPAADVAAFRAEMHAAGAAWHVTEYGDGWHGFSAPEGHRHDWIRHDPLLETVAWGSAFALFGATLGEPGPDRV